MIQDKLETKKDKKIAVFGLFESREQLEAAIDGLRTEGFRESDLSALLPDLASTKELAHEKHTRLPKARSPAPRPAVCSAERSDCSSESARWPSRASARSSPPDRSWRRSRAPAQVARSVR